MTSRKTGDMPRVDCLVIDNDTVRHGGNNFVRVLTCRQCKRNDGQGHCDHPQTNGGFMCEPNGFCSWGEPK